MFMRGKSQGRRPSSLMAPAAPPLLTGVYSRLKLQGRLPTPFGTREPGLRDYVMWQSHLVAEGSEAVSWILQDVHFSCHLNPTTSQL